MEYDLVVQPHADPSAIALAFDGANAVGVNDAGDLVVETGDGPMIQRKPDVYQMAGQHRVAVAAAYRVDGTRALLALGAYDPAETLVIDPVMAHATAFGASAADDGSASRWKKGLGASRETQPSRSRMPRGCHSPRAALKGCPTAICAR